MEKQLSGLVAELLFHHDCVIIPGFGGFVSRHVPAHVHPGTHAVYPPSKSVLFNKNLVNNDGLLANSLIERFNFSYNEAVAYIGKFTEHAHRALHQNQRLELENIGVFYLDTEKNIQFEPQEETNYLAAAFGLSAVFARPLEEPEEVVKELQLPVEMKDRKQPVERQFPVRKKRTAWAMAAIIAPVSLLLGFLIATSVAPQNSALASLNPFASHEEPRYRQQKFVMPAIKEEKSDDNVIVLNENGVGKLTLTRDMKDIVFVYVRDTVAVDRTRVVPHYTPLNHYPFRGQHVSGNYQVVIGCFREKSNAEGLVRTLRSRHVNAGITGTNANGLYVVSAGGFDTKDSAYVLLTAVRENFPAAWIMKK